MFKLICAFVFSVTSNAYAVSVDSLEGLTHTKPIMGPQENHWYSGQKILAGVKSTNSFGRFSKFDPLKSRNELFLGAKSARGWGFSMEFAYSINNRPPPTLNSPAGTDNAVEKVHASDNSFPTPASMGGYGAFNLNRGGVQDPYFDLLHPIFDDGVTSLSGIFKESFPVSANSQIFHSWIQGYYVVLNVKMKKRFGFSNIFSFNYFSKDSYTPPFDTITSLGIISTINHRLNDWLKLGLGQRSQMDSRMIMPAGKSLEIYTYADFNLTPSVFIGPRIHFPVAVQNSVFTDVPTNPAISNIQGELYLQAVL